MGPPWAQPRPQLTPRKLDLAKFGLANISQPSESNISSPINHFFNATGTRLRYLKQLLLAAACSASLLGSKELFISGQNPPGKALQQQPAVRQAFSRWLNHHPPPRAAVLTPSPLEGLTLYVLLQPLLIHLPCPI